MNGWYRVLRRTVQISATELAWSLATILCACGGASDQDGDGWTADGGDCDDTDVRRHPDAMEVCDDGIDEDCSPASCAFPTYGTGLWQAGDLGAGNGNTYAAFRPDTMEVVLVYAFEPPLLVNLVTGEFRELQGFARERGANYIPFVFGRTGLMYLDDDVVSLDGDGRLIQHVYSVNRAMYDEQGWLLLPEGQTAVCGTEGCEPGPPISPAGGWVDHALNVSQRELWLVRSSHVFAYPSGTEVGVIDEFPISSAHGAQILARRPRPGPAMAADWRDVGVGVWAPEEGTYALVRLDQEGLAPFFMQVFAFDANLDAIDDLFVVYQDGAFKTIAGFDGLTLEGELTMNDVTWWWLLYGDETVFPHVADLDGDGDDDLLLVRPGTQEYFIGYARTE